MCLLLLLPPKSSKSGADGFSINVHSLTPPYPLKKKSEPRGHWLKNTQGDKFFCMFYGGFFYLFVFISLHKE